MVLISGSPNAFLAFMVLNNRLDIELLQRIARQARIDALNAVLEIITRRQCRGDDDLNLLAIDIKRALEYELNEAAEVRLHTWLAPKSTA